MKNLRTIKGALIDLFQGNAKVDRDGLSGGKKVGITLTAAGIALLLSACGSGEVVETTVPETTVPETTISGEVLSEQLTATEDRVQAILSENVYNNDTYFQEDWDKFVADSQLVVDGKINNDDSVSFATALSIFNIDYLSQSGRNVLINQYSTGADVERLLTTEFSLSSQIREWNTEITSADDYISMSSFVLVERDRAVLEYLESLAKEVITLKADLTDANKERIQEIFDIVSSFISGTGKLEMTINGEAVQIAEAELDRGSVLVAETIAQTISVNVKDIVSQEEREQLDSELRSKDSLAKVQEQIIIYRTYGTLDGANEEAQQEMYDNYQAAFAIVEKDLVALGVTTEEAQALYTLFNIDYFMNSLEAQNVFATIYKDGFDINAMYTNAEIAVNKIMAYNDTCKDVSQIYDFSKLSLDSMIDAVSLRAMAITLFNVNSQNVEVSQASVKVVKGYTQYSSEVTVNFQTQKEDGTVVDHSYDKNALSSGAKMVCNQATLYSLKNHKSAYGVYQESLVAYVDGSTAMDPSEGITLMVKDHCADNNIVYYDYVPGNTLGK